MSQLLPIVGPVSPTGPGPEATPSIITIYKVKLKDQQLTCEFTEQRTQDAPPRAFALTCAEQIHPDLSHRLSRLVPHLCLLTEQQTETPDFWPDTAEELPARFQAFIITGFSMGKSQSGVTLIGQRGVADVAGADGHPAHGVPGQGGEFAQAQAAGVLGQGIHAHSGREGAPGPQPLRTGRRPGYGWPIHRFREQDSP